MCIFIYVEKHITVVWWGAWEKPPRGALWVLGLVGHFVQTWPDSECSHTVQFLDCSELNWRCAQSLSPVFGTVWPVWCWCAVKQWYHHHSHVVQLIILTTLLYHASFFSICHKLRYFIGIRPWRFSNTTRGNYNAASICIISFYRP